MSENDNDNHSHHNHHNHVNNDHHDHHDHHGHHDHGEMILEYKRLFWISLILTIPVLILSPMIQSWFNIDLSFKFDKYIVLILSTILLILGGKPFFVGAVDEIKAKSPGMMSLIALALFISFTYSTAVVFGLDGHDFFWEFAMLITIMLLGHYIEMKSQVAAGDALKSLSELMPSEATLISGEELLTVKTDSLKLNDVVLIRPGEKVPVDGIIIEGTSSFNESMITGESLPVERKLNDFVIAGTINGDGIVKVLINKIGEDTYINQVIKLVDEASKNRSKTERLADVFAKYLFYLSILAALITTIAWIIVGKDSNFILERVVTVIIIACPHALGLAIPLVTARTTSIAAQNGLLIKNRTLFENAKNVNAVVFDKTGTLTEGAFSVSEFKHLKHDRNDVLNIAYSLEINSNHPLAIGLVNYAESEKAELLPTSNFENISGVGIKGIINKKEYLIVSPNYLDKNNIGYDKDYVLNLQKDTNTVFFLLEEHQVIAQFALRDKIKVSAIKAVDNLKKLGIKTIMLTGDNLTTATVVANELGIDLVFAEVLPHEKALKIAELKKDYIVAMAGDGINDAPALKESDLGIAIGAGTDVAIETADIILVKSDPNDIVSLIKLSKATNRKMVQNLVWGTAYNILALPLAAGVLYSVGFLLPPAVGAILMSLSSIIVAINARLLKLE